jgi:hypothetical protein
MKGHRLLLVLGLIIAAVPLAACGAEKPTTGVYGIAVTMPGGRISGDPSPLPRGFGLSHLVPDRLAEVVIRPLEDGRPGKVVARTVADTSGIFRVPLPPGTYVIRAVDDGPPFREIVTVYAGEFAHVVVQTGARF